MVARKLRSDAVLGLTTLRVFTRVTFREALRVVAVDARTPRIPSRGVSNP